MTEFEAKAYIASMCIFLVIWLVVFIVARRRDWEWPSVQSFVYSLIIFGAIFAVLWLVLTCLMAFLTIAGVV